MKFGYTTFNPIDDQLQLIVDCELWIIQYWIVNCGLSNTGNNIFTSTYPLITCKNCLRKLK